MAVDLIASRLPDEERTYERLQQLVWALIDTAFSSHVITPGVTRTSDVVWWFRQRVNDLGLATWFHPSVSVQRRGATAQQLGEDPVIQRGDLLHCDFGLVALGLATDTQHMGYVLLPGEREPPAGLRHALAMSNRVQDIVTQELRVGRTGNDILNASLEHMRRGGIEGSVYTHPIGLHGHGAGPLIGRWDNQDGVPGRGDHKVIPGMWFSIELQATSPVPEWGGQRVWSAQEEDAIIGQDGRVRWALRRQVDLHLVR
jgi:Xaa-Pro aminopeptidase